MKKLLLSIILLPLVGCTTYRSERQIGKSEVTTYRTFLIVGKAAKINSKTKDGTYTKDLNVLDLQQSPDSELVKALVESAVAAAIKSAVKP